MDLRPRAALVGRGPHTAVASAEVEADLLVVVGAHRVVGGEDALLSAAVSPTGFVRNGKTVRAEKRAKSSVKGTGADVTPAEA